MTAVWFLFLVGGEERDSASSCRPMGCEGGPEDILVPFVK